MTTHDVSGAETLEHMRRLADLRGNANARAIYLDEVEHAHGAEYRRALAREDVRRTEDAERRVQS